MLPGGAIDPLMEIKKIVVAVVREGQRRIAEKDSERSASQEGHPDV